MVATESRNASASPSTTAPLTGAAPSPRPFGPEQPVVPASTAWADEYPFESNYLDVSGDAKGPLWLHYLDEGPKDAPVVVMLHGNPTWSFMYRHVVKALRDGYRCIVPDHMGCGLSDRPKDFDYTLENHAANVGRLLDHLGVERFSLVCHDWGGMIGYTMATARPDAYAGGVVMNTAAFLGKLPKRIATVRIPVFGKAAVLGFNAFVRAALYSCTHDKSVLTESVKGGYLAPYQTPHDRLATLRFVEDVPQAKGHATWDLVSAVDDKLPAFKELPLMALWGEKDWCFTPKFREGWQARFPNAEVHKWDDAAHFVFEDKRSEVCQHIRRFFDGNLSDADGVRAWSR